MKYLILAVVFLAACSSPAHVAGTAVAIDAPLGLPPVPIPADNPPTAASIALGRELFFDAILSADDTVSCASCHDPKLAFADGMATAKGIKGQLGKRNTPTVLNAAYYPVLFLDGRAASLEQQAGGPIANPIEMGQAHDVTAAKIGKIAVYRREFGAVFGPGEVTIQKIAMALASYERTLLSGNSAFDRYMYGGEKTAMSDAAIRGMKVFLLRDKGNCVACHDVNPKYALFTDGRFHNIGAGINASGEMTDLGRYEQTRNDADKGAFRTPGLRNVALTAPYMHDGSLKTLKDVVDFYAGGGTSNPQLDAEIHELKLSGQERADLVAFLESLTGKAQP